MTPSKWNTFGCGTTRVRAVPLRSEGRCACGEVGVLYNGLCSWCRWMANDSEVNDEMRARGQRAHSNWRYTGVGKV